MKDLSPKTLRRLDIQGFIYRALFGEPTPRIDNRDSEA